MTVWIVWTAEDHDNPWSPWRILDDAVHGTEESAIKARDRERDKRGVALITSHPIIVEEEV